MFFITQQVSDKEVLTEIYRLRYNVYVEEWHFERPGNHHLRGIETDEFDKSSIHFATKDDSKRIIGAVRLVLDSPSGFPIEKYCHLTIRTNGIPREKIAEISWITISKNYRRRAEDRYIYGPDEERRSFDGFNYTDYTNKTSRYRAEDIYKYNLPNRRKFFQERRVRHEIVVGLYKAVYCESKKLGVTHWYAVMAKGLYILLRKLGITFQPIGEQVDYYGIRTPYLGDIKEIENELSIKNPELFKEFDRG